MIRRLVMARGPLLSGAEKAEIWERRSRGQATTKIARALGRSAGGVDNFLRQTGGIRPAPIRRPAVALREGERGKAAAAAAALQAGRLGTQPAGGDQIAFALVASTNRGMAQAGVSGSGRDANLPRDDLPQPLCAGSGHPAQRVDCLPAPRPGGPQAEGTALEAGAAADHA